MYATINSVPPAGVPSGTQRSPLVASPSSGNLSDSLDSFASTFASTSKPFSQAATIVPSGWHPKEAATMPTSAERAAGMQGVVDNTVRFKPLAPKYGKTREYLPGENEPQQRLLAPDTLAETKGRKPSDYPPFGSAECLPAVLSMYQRSVPLQYKMDPTRLDSGFINSPQIQKGMRALPGDMATAKQGRSFQPGISPSASPTSTMNKFEFDLTASAAQIPVARRFNQLY